MVDKDKVLSLIKRGYSYAEVADMMGCKEQYIWQIMRENADKILMWVNPYELKYLESIKDLIVPIEKIAVRLDLSINGTKALLYIVEKQRERKKSTGNTYVFMCDNCGMRYIGVRGSSCPNLKCRNI